MTKRERLIQWANTLTTEQLKSVVVDLCYEAIESETVCFPERIQCPYWDGSGEYLIEVEL